MISFVSYLIAAYMSNTNTHTTRTHSEHKYAKAPQSVTRQTVLIESNFGNTNCVIAELIVQPSIPPSLLPSLRISEAHDTVSTHESTAPACKKRTPSRKSILQAYPSKSPLAKSRNSHSPHKGSCKCLCPHCKKHALGQRNVVEVLEDGAVLLPSQMQYCSFA